MYHSRKSESIVSHVTSSIITASVIASLPASVALAEPASEMSAASASIPWVPFCAGCAVGAVAGGLTVGLVSRRSKKRLQSELDEVVAIAQRAEESARRAESLLEQNAQRMSAEQSLDSQPTGALTKEELRNRARVVGARIADPEVQTSAPSVAQHTSGTDVVSTTTLVGKHAARPRTQDSDVTNALPREKRGVRSILQDRLGTGVLEGLPVIDRGETRAAGEPFVAPAPQKTRSFDPVARAAIIDRRLPRFDESLFPDVESETHQEVDDFMIAMQAMEDSLSATNPTSAPAEEQPTGRLGAPVDRPDISETESYIEYLVQDELERNRSGEPRRFSRAHLTVFEGTGDLSAARKATQQPAQYRPRHMQPKQGEAQVL